MSVARTATATVNAERLTRLASSLRADIKSGLVHGASMRVSLQGETIFDFMEGYADKAAGRHLQRDSVFVTMSVAKLWTNVLALGLVEKGLLRLHEPVSEIIPGFRQFGKEKVNLYQLMTHTSGVMRSIPSVGAEIVSNIERLTEYVCGLPLECLPGEQVNYSILVAHSIIATMCVRVNGRGRTYAAMLDEDLFRPLGMVHTSLGPRDDLMARLCPVRGTQDLPYNQLPPAALEHGFETMMLSPGSEVPAAGGLTTIGDLHRFTEMLRRGGELDGRRILSPAMIQYCARDFTGPMRNSVWDASLSARDWQVVPANLGIGFLVRGQGVRPGPFGMLNSPESFGGFGSGSTGAWVDPQHGLAFSFLSTGLLEDSHHLERTARLSDFVMAALAG